MVKKVGIPKKKKVINLTKKMQKKYAEFVKDFKEVVIFSCRAETKYLASFNCGILKDGRSHLIKGANRVLLTAIGLNQEGTDVEKTSLEMTIMELLALRKAIDDTIEVYETETGEKLLPLQKEGKKQKAKTNKLMDFKIEK